MLSIFNGLNSLSVMGNGTEHTYEELRERTFSISNKLNERHVKRIMIDLPQGFLAYCIMWASYISNVVFCCVNCDLPSNYKSYCIETFKPNLVIRSGEDIDDISDKLLFLEEKVQHITEDTAYVLFTSGSTGRPKGISVKRSALENFVEWCSHNYSLSPGDIYGQYSNISFDLGVGDVFFGLATGATMVPIVGLQKLIPGQAIKDKRITFWHSVPSVIDLIIKRGDIEAGFLSSLKEATFCGEPLYPSQVETLLNYNENLRVWNTYGPTETTIFCSAIMINRCNYKEFSHKSVSIGVPITGFEFKYLKNSDKQTELVIYSKYVANGYLNDVENSGFIYDECTGESCGFKTGDIVDVFDGNIYFVGRVDSQIKIGGYRVDLNEIDSIIREKTSFASCSVFNQNKIVTFVEDTAFIDANLVLSAIEENLPPYYRPSRIKIIPSLPKNINGKYDRKILIENYL